MEGLHLLWKAQSAKQGVEKEKLLDLFEEEVTHSWNIYIEKK